MKQTIRKQLSETKNVKIETDEGINGELQRQKTMFQKDKSKYYKIDRKSRSKLKKYPEKSYLITFKFMNGTKKTFAIKTDSNTFKIKNKLYYLYWEEAWYNISMNQYELEYIENCPVPINREITYVGDEAFNSVSPEVLMPFVKGEYIKLLANAQNISKIMMAVLMVTIFNIVISLINVFMIFRMGK